MKDNQTKSKEPKTIKQLIEENKKKSLEDGIPKYEEQLEYEDFPEYLYLIED